MEMSQQQNGNKKDALKDYVDVNKRIESFWIKYPEGRIDTEIVKWEDAVIVMKVCVYTHRDNEKPSATGHAYEKEGSSFINKLSALENCETSAVGRALAILGFEIKKSIASRQEVQNATTQKPKELIKVDEKQLEELENKILEFANIQKIDRTAILSALKVKTLEGINSLQFEGFMAQLDAWINKAKQIQAQGDK